MEAILNGEIQFAKDLNKALKILGIKSKKEIISSLSDDYEAIPISDEPFYFDS